LLGHLLPGAAVTRFAIGARMSRLARHSSEVFMALISRRAVLATSAAVPFAAWAQPAPGSYGSVRRLSLALDAVIAPDAPVEQIAWGYQWTEGPVWVKDGGYLLFSDPPQNTIYRWDQAAGAQVFLKPSGYSGDPDPALREPGANGLAIDASGALMMCDSGNRALARVDLKTKKKQIIVDKLEGKRFNSPNDLCISRSGAIYFTDPPFGLTDGAASPVKEQAFSGVYRWAPDGSVTVIDKDLAFPNGVALSPDESVLYVSNCDKTMPVIKAYALGADGLPQSASMFFDMKPLMSPESKGLPDGIKVDVNGNLFAAGPGGIVVLSKEGKLLGLINVTGRAQPNCAFADDGSTLIICATDIVARVKLKTKGANFA
jgi:gluconolactonase